MVIDERGGGGGVPFAVDGLGSGELSFGIFLERVLDLNDWRLCGCIDVFVGLI